MNEGDVVQGIRENMNGPSSALENEWVHTTSGAVILCSEDHALCRMISEIAGGSVYAAKLGIPCGYTVSLTNHHVRGSKLKALCRVRRLACEFAAMNPSLSNSLIIGWWRNVRGDLFIDLGIELKDGHTALSVKHAFCQYAIAIIGPTGEVCVTADDHEIIQHGAQQFNN